MGKFLNLAGKRFGRLKALCPMRKPSVKEIYWLCECDCGSRKEIRGADLRRGATQSCGCITKTLGGASKVAGKKDLTYQTWRAMINRCTRPKNQDWKHYGGRGIKVCDRWLQSFEAFVLDMGRRPGSEYTLDRKDCDGDYEPTNCRWAISSEQQRNRRNTIKLTFRGETKPIAVWAEEIGIHPNSIKTRLKLGWSVEKALTTPVKPVGRNHRKQAISNIDRANGRIEQQMEAQAV